MYVRNKYGSKVALFVRNKKERGALFLLYEKKRKRDYTPWWSESLKVSFVQWGKK